MHSKGFQEFDKTGLGNTVRALLLVALRANAVGIQKRTHKRQSSTQGNCSRMIKSRFPEKQGWELNPFQKQHRGSLAEFPQILRIFNYPAGDYLCCSLSPLPGCLTL